MFAGEKEKTEGRCVQERNKKPFGNMHALGRGSKACWREIGMQSKADWGEVRRGKTA